MSSFITRNTITQIHNNQLCVTQDSIVHFNHILQINHPCIFNWPILNLIYQNHKLPFPWFITIYFQINEKTCYYHFMHLESCNYHFQLLIHTIISLQKSYNTIRVSKFQFCLCPKIIYMINTLNLLWF